MGTSVFAGFIFWIFWAIGLYVLYWVIRLAVRHGIEDAEFRRQQRADRRRVTGSEP